MPDTSTIARTMNEHNGMFHNKSSFRYPAIVRLQAAPLYLPYNITTSTVAKAHFVTQSGSAEGGSPLSDTLSGLARVGFATPVSSPRHSERREESLCGPAEILRGAQNDTRGTSFTPCTPQL